MASGGDFIQDGIGADPRLDPVDLTAATDSASPLGLPPSHSAPATTGPVQCTRLAVP